MKTRSLTHLSLVLALLGLPFAGGCTQSSANSAEPELTNAQPAVVQSAGDSSSATAAAETATPVSSVQHAEPVLPPNILPATPLAEVIKLAQSGVGDNVMLAFITNSVKPFELNAEEIVYLNDLGVTSSVITTILQHDQGLKPLPSNLTSPAAPPPPEPEAVAVAPTYVNPPVATPVAEAQPTYVSNNYFYDSLAPYGRWIEVEGYGRCWQPTVVVANRDWQPYCDRGRWVYTDAGWYWLSDYSWGATTFHYGRWFAHPSWGWCWWPDTVWAPSWVNWRYSGTYCGWAPLPPMACYDAGFGFSYYGSSVGISFGFGLGVSAYTFVPWGNFCGARPYQHRVPPQHASQVYNNSTVINNYGRGNNNTVINRGISPEHVRAYSRTEVRIVHIRDQVANGPRNERLERDGRTLAVHRPQLTSLKGSGDGRMDAPDRSALRPGVPRATTPTLSGTSQEAARIPAGRSERGGGKGSSAGVEFPSTVVPKTPPASTPRINQPRVIQVTPQNTTRPAAAPAGSLVVIGGRSSSRSGGRDYSVWSTPSPASVTSDSGGSPRTGVPSSAAAAPVVSSPTVTKASPAPASRPPAEQVVASRDSYATFSTPSPNASTYTPLPEPVNSTPSYAPRSAPPNSAPKGQRFESRSAPAGSATGPAQSSSRPGSSSGPRSR